MKVLVLGASGLVGRTLCKLLRETNIDYLGTYNQNKIEGSVYVNFNNDNEVEKLFDDYKPDICVISIVQRLVDVCEENWELTKFTNVDIVNKVAKVCSMRNIYVVHISTDYVFDGLNPPYLPDTIPNPLQNYGISKLMSEYKIRNKLKNYSIIRVPVLYSNDIYNIEESAVTLIGKKVFDLTKKTKEDNFSIRRPVFIPDLCNFILDIITNSDKYNGIYHFYNYKDKVTKYIMARMIGDCINKSTEHISPIDHQEDTAERPIDTQLLDPKYNIENFNITTIVEGIDLCFKKFYHPNIYDSNTKTSDIFMLLDLDGTLIDSDNIHIECYNKALSDLGFGIRITEYEVNHSTIDKFLEDSLIKADVEEVKNLKNIYMLNYAKDIPLINGAEKLINHIVKNKINHCVVTNTSLGIVNMFKQKNPILANLNFITKEDYSNPKPHPEPYQVGKDKYYKNEKYIIGFENSLSGFKSLKFQTPIIYMVINNNQEFYKRIKKEDVFLINDLTNLK